MTARLPTPRGPLTEMLCTRLRGSSERIREWLIPDESPLTGQDFQLALHVCYGLHYDGFGGVDESWEWEPSLLALRARLEAKFLSALIAEAELRDTGPGIGIKSLIPRVRELVKSGDGPSLSRFMTEQGTKDELREFVIHRSVYQRKEADPHTWAIPRLRGRAKSALVTLQADEYGRGDPGRSHAELFANTMVALGLDPTPGAYIDRVPGVTLATDNLVSFFGLHRRWRGALVGHLAAFEMTSVIPMSRYAAAIRRILNDDGAAEFYDVHVTADVRHAQIATDELITGLVESDPKVARDIPFGSAALLAVEARFAEHLLASWAVGRTSLAEQECMQRNPFATTAQPPFVGTLCLDEISPALAEDVTAN